MSIRNIVAGLVLLIGLCVGQIVLAQSIGGGSGIYSAKGSGGGGGGGGCAGTLDLSTGCGTPQIGIR